jgi:peptidoglycan/LPS O-acetylase OafA/YrhL
MSLARVRQAFSFKANVRSLWFRPSERYAAVDGLRAMAMLWVVLTHLSLALSAMVPYDAYVATMDRLPWLFPWVLHGEKSIDTFFVISGFLIGGMLLGEEKRAGRVAVPRFFARRYLRLMPAYAVSIALLLAIGVDADKAKYVWANLLYVNNFLPRQHMFMDPSWSLAVEEQFYVLMPFFLTFVFLRAQHKARLLGALVALSLVIDAVVIARHPHVTAVSYGAHFIWCAPGYDSEYFDAIYVNLYTRFAPFLFGFWVAWGQSAFEPRLRALFDTRPALTEALLAGGVLLMVGVCAVPACDPRVTLPYAARWAFVLLQRHVWAAGIAMVLVAVIHARGALSRGARAFLAARVWYLVAQLSYTGYLFHLYCVLPALAIALTIAHPGQPFLDAVKTLQASEFLVAYALTLALSFLVGSFVYLAVERPLLEMRPR